MWIVQIEAPTEDVATAYATWLTSHGIQLATCYEAPDRRRPPDAMAAIVTDLRGRKTPEETA